MMTNILGVIDFPARGQTIAGVATLAGWVLVEAPHAPIELWLNDQLLPVSLARSLRPDVLEVYPAWVGRVSHPGFVGALPTWQYANGTYELKCKVGGQVVTANQFIINNTPAEEFYRSVETDLAEASPHRQQKLMRLQPRLRCLKCHAPLNAEAQQFVCAGCGGVYPLTPEHILVTYQREYPLADAIETKLVSNHPYPAEVLQVLAQVRERGGWALDVGSGRRLFASECLVQTEICAYPFTDLINQTEQLPFVDETFDFVFSLAVTEHVARPWALAKEMQRVLKRGGTLRVDSAFLQPLHDYPAHYFNMTPTALKELFNEIQIETLAPVATQHPFFSLSWILARLLNSVPPVQKDWLAQMSLAQFAHELAGYCAGQPSALHALVLPPDVRAELAAGFTLHGFKR